MSYQIASAGIINAREFKEKLRKMSDDVQGQILHDAAIAGAEQFLAPIRARAAVLKIPDPRRIPGLMKSLIKSWVSLQKVGRIVVSAGIDLRELMKIMPPKKRVKGDAPDFLYPLYTEYGTGKEPAQPFFRPGFDSSKDAAANATISVFKTGLEAFAE